MAGNAARVMAQQGRARAVAATPGTGTGASTLGGVKTRDLMLFFRQFASLVNSGFTVYGALDSLAPRTHNANLAAVAKELGEAARSGRRISEVMAHYPRIFPDHVAGMVNAGETGGFLEIALQEIADGYDRNIALYRGAWVPKLMATQAFFLLFLMQPLFTSLFNQFDMTEGVKLYFRLVLFRNLPIAFALYFAMLYVAKRAQLPQFRRKRDEIGLKMPAFGDLQRQVAIEAFLKMLSRLYHAGVSPIQAWEGAMNTASNVVIREKLASSYELMQRGASLSDAFTATGLFTDQVEQLVFTGQQSGQVVEMLDQATAYYREKADEAAGKSKFMMFRLGLLVLLIFGGATVAWLAHTYFAGIFHYVDSNFGE
jgi:type IV pilus assembly protein PilC